jgi:glycosyltransferase involved in cell wall biosynthesis
MLLTIVVTVFNEKDTVIEAIRQVEKLDLEKEIIVVDNCSTDGTRELLKTYPGTAVQMVLQERNYGYGQSIITGCDMARGEYLYVHNADLEYDPSHVHEMIEWANREGYDAVFGSRLAHRSTSYLRLIRERPYYLAAVISTWMINAFYGTNFTDIIGSKFYRMSSLRKLYPISDRSITFDFEVVSKLCKRGYRIKEIPVSYQPRSRKEGKKIKMFDSLPALVAMLKVKLFD